MSHIVQYKQLAVDTDRPVVFLDLCGVVGDTWPIHDGMDFVDPEYIQYFKGGDYIYLPIWNIMKRIFQKYNAQIVIVSSWLSSYLPSDDSDVNELADFLDYPLNGSLMTSGGYGRGDAVKEMITSLKLTNWIVIDDSKEQMYKDSTFFNQYHFVNPDAFTGMSIRDVVYLECLLNDRTSEDYLITDYDRDKLAVYSRQPETLSPETLGRYFFRENGIDDLVINGNRYIYRPNNPVNKLLVIESDGAKPEPLTKAKILDVLIHFKEQWNLITSDQSI